jgi:hypothetical protein
VFCGLRSNAWPIWALLWAGTAAVLCIAMLQCRARRLRDRQQMEGLLRVYFHGGRKSMR